MHVQKRAWESSTFVCVMVTLSSKRFFLAIFLTVKIALDCQIFEIKIAYTLAHENVRDALTILYYLKE